MNSLSDQAIAEKAANEIWSAQGSEQTKARILKIILPAITAARREKRKAELDQICADAEKQAAEIIANTKPIRDEIWGLPEADVSAGDPPKQKGVPYDYAPWKPPFHYDEMGSKIMDSENQMCLDVRGWGFLTGTGGGLAMSEERAAAIQDALGEHVTRLLNLTSVGKAWTALNAPGVSAEGEELTSSASGKQKEEYIWSPDNQGLPESLDKGACVSAEDATRQKE